MEGLYQLFQSTFDANPNTRKAAELEIRKVAPQPGMLTSALQIVMLDEADLGVRQAAAIYVKNRIVRYWSTDEKWVQKNPTQAHQSVPAQDKQQIKSVILDVLVRSPPQIRVHMAAALGGIVKEDYPAQWPELLGSVQSLLQSNDANSTHAGVRALLEIVKIYRWKDKAADLLEPIVSATFPTILATAKALLDSPESSNPQVGEIIYLILKVYKTSITSQLTQHHQSNDSIVPWGTLFLAVVQKQVDPAQLPADEDEREKAAWSKAKKWAMFSLNKLFSRFGNPSQLPSNMKQYSAFAERFVNSFAPEILKVYLRTSEAKISGQWVSKKAIHYLFMFFTECIKPKSTWLLLKPHVDTIVQRFVFPLLCYSEETDELWELDPIDFVRLQLDPLDDFGTPPASAATFLQTVAAKRTKSSFMPQLEFITSVVNAYPASRTPFEKEGALNMVKALEPTMTSHSKVGGLLEGFFVQHVIPELGSPHRFLRFRAADLVCAFASKMAWSETKNLEACFTGIMNCLNDAEMPVKVMAADAIGSLVDHDEVHTAMAPNAGRLMPELLKLSDEIDLDVLTSTKSKIVANFAEELLPFSVQLCQQLSDTYMRLVQESLAAAAKGEDAIPDAEESKREEDKMFASLSCLHTLYSVLASAESKPELLGELERTVLPLVAFTLENNCVELFDDCFDLTDVLTFYQKRVSDGMWGIFRLMHKAFKGQGIDFLGEMLSTLDNIVSYGKDAFLQNAELRDMLLDIFHTGMTAEQLGTADHISACKLADVFLLLLKGGLDDALPGIVQQLLAASTSAGPEAKPLRRWGTMALYDALCYNGGLTLQILESSGATVAFFERALKYLPKFTRVHERKVVAVGIMSVLQLPADSVPQSVREGYPALLNGLAQVLSGLPEALRRRKEEQEMFENVDSDDEDVGEMSRENVDDAEVDEDVLDEDNEYLELLAKEGEIARARLSALQSGDVGDDDDDEEEEDDDEDEEIVFESPMDSVPVFEAYRSLLSSNAGLQAVAASLSPEQQQLLRAVSELQDEETPAPPAIPIA